MYCTSLDQNSIRSMHKLMKLRKEQQRFLWLMNIISSLYYTNWRVYYVSWIILTVEGVSGDVARVETFIVKMCHKKRKESSSPLMQVTK